MDRRTNNMSAREYAKVALQLDEACSKANAASYDACPCFDIHERSERAGCRVSYSSIVGLGLYLDASINIETVPRFLGWLRDVFPEEFKMVAEGG